MNSFDAWALTLQLGSCFLMTGVILVIQFIHYPCFSSIDAGKFTEFHGRHTSALGFIAGPIMVIELFSALFLARSGDLVFVANAVGVLALWGITFLVSVPVHGKLAKAFEEEAWRKLVRTNWLRTFLWSVRSLGMLVLVAMVLSAKA